MPGCLEKNKSEPYLRIYNSNLFLTLYQLTLKCLKWKQYYLFGWLCVSGGWAYVQREWSHSHYCTQFCTECWCPCPLHGSRRVIRSDGTWFSWRLWATCASLVPARTLWYLVPLTQHQLFTCISQFGSSSPQLVQQSNLFFSFSMKKTNSSMNKHFFVEAKIC